MNTKNIGAVNEKKINSRKSQYVFTVINSNLTLSFISIFAKNTEVAYAKIMSR